MSYANHKREVKDYIGDALINGKKVRYVRDFPNKKLKMILSSEKFALSIKPILMQHLGSDLDNKKVVLIPNAGIGTEKMEMVYQHLVEFTTLHNMYLKLIDIEKWDKKLILKAIIDCDALAISGGLVSRLIKTIDRVGIREELVKTIQMGKPYIGFSAGSMIVSNTTNFVKDFMGEPDPDVEELKPLGLVDFEIYPHFENTMLLSVQKMVAEGEEAYAVHNDEALVISNGKLLEVGEPIHLHEV